MLNLPKCVVKQASTVKVSELVSRLEEGVFLVATLEDGILKATPSTGVANEAFVGVSQNRVSAPEYAPIYEEFTIPGSAPYTLKLSKLPYGTDRGLFIAGEEANVITTGSPAAAGDVLLDANGNLTFHSADAGKKVSTLYRYALTQTEAGFMFGGDLVPFVRIPQVETTVIEVGRVFTDHYVLGDDWANSTYAYLGADGRLTTTTTGTKVGVVSGLPSVSDGFLGVDISV